MEEKINKSFLFLPFSQLIKMALLHALKLTFFLTSSRRDFTFLRAMWMFDHGNNTLQAFFRSPCTPVFWVWATSYWKKKSSSTLVSHLKARETYICTLFLTFSNFWLSIFVVYPTSPITFAFCDLFLSVCTLHTIFSPLFCLIWLCTPPLFSQSLHVFFCTKVFSWKRGKKSSYFPHRAFFIISAFFLGGPRNMLVKIDWMQLFRIFLLFFFSVSLFSSRYRELSVKTELKY